MPGIFFVFQLILARGRAPALVPELRVATGCDNLADNYS